MKHFKSMSVITTTAPQNVEALSLEHVKGRLGGGGGGGALAQSVKRATPGAEVLGSLPAVAARSILIGSMSV